MAKEVDIVALGELLIDSTEAGKSDSGKKLVEFRQFLKKKKQKVCVSK